MKEWGHKAIVQEDKSNPGRRVGHYGSYWLRLWLLFFWTPFSTKVWLGLTICWRRTSERNLSVGSLHALVPCFTWFHQAWLIKLPCARQKRVPHRVDCALSTTVEAPLSPAKLPFSYPFFPILALHRSLTLLTFATYGVGSLLNFVSAVLDLNVLIISHHWIFFIQLWTNYADCRVLCPGPSWHLSSVEQQKTKKYTWASKECSR